MPITTDTVERVREIIARYPQAAVGAAADAAPGAGEEGYVSPDGIALCAEELGLTKAEVGAVATFYTMYKRAPDRRLLTSASAPTRCAR